MKNNRYPFPVRSRGNVVVTSHNLHTAINKVLALHPDKFVKTKYAKNVEQYLIRLNDKECCKVSTHNGYSSGSLINDEDRLEELTPNIKTKLKHKLFMDLITARARALKESANNKGKSIYVNVKPDGECMLEPVADVTTWAAFRQGIEIAVPVAPTLTRKILISKHKPTKKMKLPDDLDLPQGVELPQEEPKKLKNKKLPQLDSTQGKKGSKKPTPQEETEQPQEETESTPEAPREKGQGKRAGRAKVSPRVPQKGQKAKVLKVSKLAKQAPRVKMEVLKGGQEVTPKKATNAPNLPQVKRSVKTATKGRKKTALPKKAKNKPTAQELEQAKRTLQLWAKERAESAPTKKVKKKVKK